MPQFPPNNRVSVSRLINVSALFYCYIEPLQPARIIAEQTIKEPNIEKGHKRRIPKNTENICAS
jgi:hypothetical protein